MEKALEESNKRVEHLSEQLAVARARAKMVRDLTHTSATFKTKIVENVSEVDMVVRMCIDLRGMGLRINETARPEVEGRAQAARVIADLTA